MTTWAHCVIHTTNILRESVLRQLTQADEATGKRTSHQHHVDEPEDDLVELPASDLRASLNGIFPKEGLREAHRLPNNPHDSDHNVHGNSRVVTKDLGKALPTLGLAVLRRHEAFEDLGHSCLRLVVHTFVVSSRSFFDDLRLSHDNCLLVFLDLVDDVS